MFTISATATPLASVTQRLRCDASGSPCDGDSGVKEILADISRDLPTYTQIPINIRQNLCSAGLSSAGGSWTVFCESSSRCSSVSALRETRGVPGFSCGEADIHLCPNTFLDERQLKRTILHEMLHTCIKKRRGARSLDDASHRSIELWTQKVFP